MVGRRPGADGGKRESWAVTWRRVASGPDGGDVSEERPDVDETGRHGAATPSIGRSHLSLTANVSTVFRQRLTHVLSRCGGGGASRKPARSIRRVSDAANDRSGSAGRFCYADAMLTTNAVNAVAHLQQRLSVMIADRHHYRPGRSKRSDAAMHGRSRRRCRRLLCRLNYCRTASEARQRSPTVLVRTTRLRRVTW